MTGVSDKRKLLVAILGLGAILYVPFAGNYGMWDPWETHYGEVARQMLERNDFVSQWWPGSPQDRAEFWSKPVLTFWLMAISMKVFGLEWHPHSAADEMAASWRPEWACRLPFVILGILGAWATYELVRRLIGKRPAMLTALILLTSSQWALISRQAMTDMAFVVPMTIALALAGLALLLPAEEVEVELPRKLAFRIAGHAITYPDAGAWKGFFWLTVLSVVPQLIVISAQVQMVVHLKSFSLKGPGIVPMLPYWIALLAGLWWCAQAKNHRQLYLFSAYVLCGIASLAKGPAGLIIPAGVMGIYLVVSGRWREIWTHLEIPRGALLFVATAFPWYHAMLIRHGMGFWNEFIGDNYVRRAGGRHGDRGTFEYYVQYIGYGMFPWSGFVGVGSLWAFRWMRGQGSRARLAGFAIVWALVDWSLVSLVNTKFHHYILPALPALAILAALCIDELIERADRSLVLGMIFIGVPLTLVCGHDLAAFPARLLWMFNYDYVNMPGTGRPWPLASLYGDRYEYGRQMHLIAIAVTLATLAFVWLARRRAKPDDEVADDLTSGEGPYRSAPPTEASTVEAQPTQAATVVVFAAGFAVLLAVAILAGPASPHGAAPVIGRWLWLVPVACMMPVFFLFTRAAVAHAQPAARTAFIGLGLLSAVWTGFVIDKVLVELSPHWAQKHVIAAYYSNRKSADEPLVAWLLYWRGENFYSKNVIYKDSDPNERTVFLGDRNVEKMQKWFAAHPGKKVFFIVERLRFESLRGTLPEKARPTLKIVDESNNKLYLVSAQL